MFANLIIFVRKPFFGILFSNISNTSKLSDETLNYPFVTTQRPALVLTSRTNTPIFCIAATSGLIVLSASDKTSDISLTEIRGLFSIIFLISFCLSVSWTGDKLVIFFGDTTNICHLHKLCALDGYLLGCPVQCSNFRVKKKLVLLLTL